MKEGYERKFENEQLNQVVNKVADGLPLMPGEWPIFGRYLTRCRRWLRSAQREATRRVTGAATAKRQARVLVLAREADKILGEYERTAEGPCPYGSVWMQAMRYDVVKAWAKMHAIRELISQMPRNPQQEASLHFQECRPKAGGQQPQGLPGSEPKRGQAKKETEVG